MTLIEAEQYVDRLIAMRNMESRSYQCIGYLEYVNDNLENGETKSRTLDHHRQRISQWMYQLLDALKVDREIVYFSMNLLDRFLSRSVEEHNIDNYIGGSQYELASLTSLYIAIKINTNQHHPVHIERFEKLSRHKFTKHDISGMELVILTTLKWNVFPPSPAEYVGNYLSVLALQGSTKLCEKIMDISLFLTELAVCDYFFKVFKVKRKTMKVKLSLRRRGMRVMVIHHHNYNNNHSNQRNRSQQQM